MATAKIWVTGNGRIQKVEATPELLLELLSRESNIRASTKHEIKYATIYKDK